MRLQRSIPFKVQSIMSIQKPKLFFCFSLSLNSPAQTLTHNNFVWFNSILTWLWFSSTRSKLQIRGFHFGQSTLIAWKVFVSIRQEDSLRETIFGLIFQACYYCIHVEVISERYFLAKCNRSMASRIFKMRLKWQTCEHNSINNNNNNSIYTE